MASQDAAPESVVFVCWGNICRSPMAEQVARHLAPESGLGDVSFTSAGVSSEETGASMDPRAAEVLRRHGYPVSDHVAHRIDSTELASADLVIAMEPFHVDRLRRLGDTTHVRLLTDFDPDTEAGAGVPDPWYGTPEAFEKTLASVEAAVPGVLDTIRARRDTAS